MRSIWVLILFGSLIIHHSFATISGEAVQSKETQPSYSDCKPYVDAALKGDIPKEPPPVTLPDRKDSVEDADDENDTTVTNEKIKPIGNDDDSSEEEEQDKNHVVDDDDDDSSEEVKVDKGYHKVVEDQEDSDSTEDDHEEPEIKGLEIDDDDEDEEETTKVSKENTTKEDDSESEEEVLLIPQTTKGPQTTKNNAEGKKSGNLKVTNQMKKILETQLQRIRIQRLLNETEAIVILWPMTLTSPTNQKNPQKKKLKKLRLVPKNPKSK